jgi:hypothetical protein
MRTIGRSKPRRRIAELAARMLALALLVPITYAVTFGTVHSHAGHPSTTEFGQVTHDRLIAVETLGQQAARDSHGDGCLVCSLRQQIFSSSFADARFITPTQNVARSISTANSGHYTAHALAGPTERISGRAPPSA